MKSSALSKTKAELERDFCLELNKVADRWHRFSGAISGFPVAELLRESHRLWWEALRLYNLGLCRGYGKIAPTTAEIPVRLVMDRARRIIHGYPEEGIIRKLTPRQLEEREAILGARVMQERGRTGTFAEYKEKSKESIPKLLQILAA